MINTTVSKQRNNQDLQWNLTNKLRSEATYKSDVWVTSIGFEYSYSIIPLVPFVTQKSGKSPLLYCSLT